MLTEKDEKMKFLKTSIKSSGFGLLNLRCLAK